LPAHAHLLVSRATAVEPEQLASRRPGRPEQSPSSGAAALALLREPRPEVDAPTRGAYFASSPDSRTSGLRVGSVSDPAEADAERFASRVDGASGPVRRRCACGGTVGPNGECSECKARRGRPVPAESTQAVAPPIVHEVLRASGQPLDASSREYFEPLLGVRLADVRVHKDARAAASAESVGALAYTAGADVVFAQGLFDPCTGTGRRLLAHELAHVAQNRTGAATLRRQTTPNPIDPTAQAIITAAQATATPIEDRATQAVRAIIATYYASQASKVANVVYREAEPGLATTYSGTGASITGTITVGRYFVENTTSAGIARRVLQVGHELQHIDQQRAGMGGAAKRHLREFLAFHWEATAPEAAGTGRVSHSTRVALIDAALGNYNCLDDTEKSAQLTKQQQLLTLRASEQAASGQPATPAPTACAG
jgi:uncharacterized protein DUF4157